MSSFARRSLQSTSRVKRAWRNQLAIGQWNLARLAETFCFGHTGGAEEALGEYLALYRDRTELMAPKFGFADARARMPS